jgi:hypothetical protein
MSVWVEAIPCFRFRRLARSTWRETASSHVFGAGSRVTITPASHRQAALSSQPSRHSRFTQRFRSARFWKHVAEEAAQIRPDIEVASN